MLQLRMLMSLAMAFYATNSLAADLTNLDRTLVKEPPYRSQPRYALLAFGPAATTRVWLVHDGDRLYVDRNGNGDITESGEAVSAKLDKRITPDAGVYEFEVGDIAEGTLLHKGLHCSTLKVDHLADSHDDVKAFLAKQPAARPYRVGIDIENPGHPGGGIGGRVEQLAGFADLNGVLYFAERPADAPVVHFRGPLTVSLYDRPKLTIGRQKQLVLAVGTPGAGPGTTALVAYEGFIPRDVHPQVEVEFPPERPGSPPLRRLYELKSRC